jgi:hypothetical protein
VIGVNPGESGIIMKANDGVCVVVRVEGYLINTGDCFIMAELGVVLVGVSRGGDQEKEGDAEE